ncbi:MAG TPA: RNA pseudouridine synthase [Myxococcales bacterium LLY-WYZ-16_1]|nr:RNA pseudouridine synthase [Myxococcales bacterium LLY-WYZ-16_1]
MTSELSLLDETVDLWVIDKPAGMAMPDERELASSFSRAARLVHRLDRDTTGVWVVAKSAAGAERASRAFRDRTARKIYWAVVLRHPELEWVDAPIGPDPRRPRTFRVRTDGRPARTTIRTVQVFGRLHWVEARPHTGRPHQVRIHLAEAGAPIWGDLRYEGDAGARVDGQLRKAPRPLLHARSLELPELGPAGGWQAPVPADFVEFAPELDWPDRAVTSPTA